jgi:hypothetical protein
VSESRGTATAKGILDAAGAATPSLRSVGWPDDVDFVTRAEARAYCLDPVDEKEGSA